MSKNPPTILFIAPSAYPLGGVQTWLDYLLPGLNNQKYRAVLALTSGEFHDVEAYKSSHPFDDVEIISAPSGSTQGRVNALQKLIIKIEPCITVNINIVDVYNAINNLRKNSLTKTKLVTTIHGIQGDLFASINRNSDIIDAVISTNKLTQKLINSATNIKPEDSYYAPYGVNEHKTLSNRNPQSFTIAYAGRIEEQQKRIDDLLSIFSRLLEEIDNLKIIIAGGGEDISKLIHWQKKQSRHTDKINYLGVIEPDNVAKEVYSKADALLLTSQWETGPIVAWEAMQNEVCFISSRYIGSVEEKSLVNGHNCLLFDIGDIEGAVEKIQSAKDTKIRSELIFQAKKLIDQRYTQTRSIEHWRSHFDKIVKKKAKPYSKDTFFSVDKGRLNQLLNVTLGKHSLVFAEKIRNLFGFRFQHNSAGGEWPHCADVDMLEPIQLDDYFNSSDQ